MNPIAFITKSTARKVIAGAAGAAATVAVALTLSFGAVHAQTATPTTSTAAKATTPGAARHARMDEFLQRVAGKLGVSADQLKAAIVGAEHDEVNARVVSGKLTQEQADRLNQRIDRAGPGFLPRLLIARRLWSR